MRDEKTTQQHRIRLGPVATELAATLAGEGNQITQEMLDSAILILQERADTASTNNNNPELSKKMDQVLKALEIKSTASPRDDNLGATVRTLGDDLRYKFNQFGDLLHDDHRVTFAGISKIAMEVSLLRFALKSMAAEGSSLQNEMILNANKAIEHMNENVKEFRIREGFEFPKMGKKWRESIMALNESRSGLDHDLDPQHRERGDEERER